MMHCESAGEASVRGTPAGTSVDKKKATIVVADLDEALSL